MKIALRKSKAPVARPLLSSVVARELGQCLDEGMWSDRLPGIHVLMKRLGVSAPPIQQALAVLEGEGRIGAAERGRGRAILMQPARQDLRHLLVCAPAPSEVTDLTRAIGWDLEASINGTGMPWQMVHRSERRRGRYVEMLAEQLSERNIAGVIGLDVPHRELRDVFGMEMPLLQIASLDFEDPKASQVVVDLAELLEAGLPHLFSLGYRKIGLLCAFRAPIHRKLLESLRELHRQHGIPFSGEIQFPHARDADFARTLRQMTAGHGLDLLLTVRDTHWARALWELNAIGVSVPVLNLWASPVFKDFESPPQLLELRMRTFSRWISLWCGTISEGRVPEFRRKVGFRVAWRV